MELLQLQKLMKNLEEFENITKQLQDPTTTLSDVRAIFDAVLEKYDSVSLNIYLAVDANIIHSHAFETGIVKVLDDAVDQLTAEEENDISCFRQTPGMNIGNASGDDELTLVQKALKNKRRKVVHGEYSSLNFVPPTSNVVERLFSNARLVLTDYRKSMTPYTFECVMFLKINRGFWNLDTVAKVVGK